MRQYPVISHVIPLRLLQTLNLHRWNCNVFAWSRKITVLNYVRNLSGSGFPRPPAPRPGLVSMPGRAHRPLRSSRGMPHLWRGFCTIRSILSACRRRVAALMVQFPRLVVVWSRFEVVSRPKCRPPRRKTPTMGSRGRGRLRWQHNDAWPRASLAHSPLRCEREPAIACANRLFRT